MKTQYELFLVNNLDLVSAFKDYLHSMDAEYRFGLICRPGVEIRESWVATNLSLTDEELDYIILRFGVIPRKLNETET